MQVIVIAAIHPLRLEGIVIAAIHPPRKVINVQASYREDPSAAEAIHPPRICNPPGPGSPIISRVHLRRPIKMVMARKG